MTLSNFIEIDLLNSATRSFGKVRIIRSQKKPGLFLAC